MNSAERRGVTQAWPFPPESRSGLLNDGPEEQCQKKKAGRQVKRDE
jgi:hypothetical protein